MNSENKISIKGIAVWTICCIFFIYEFFLRTSLGTFQDPIMRDLDLNTFQFAILSSTIFTAIYGIMQIPVGFILDRLGLKKSLFMGSLFCAISTLCFAYSSDLKVAIIFRFFTGAGASFGFICLLMSVYDWLPKRYNSILIGVSQFVGTLGPMMGAGPLNSLVESGDHEWREIFIYLGIAGIIISVLVLIFAENNIDKKGKFLVLKRPEKLTTSLIKLFSKPQAWYVAIISSFIYLPLEYLTENEGRLFIMLKGHESVFASYLLSLSWIGFAIGCPATGFASDMLQRRRLILIATSAISLASINMIIFGESATTLLIAFFSLGFAAGGLSIGFTTITENFQKQFVAIAYGLNNTIIAFFCAAIAPFIGAILEYVSVTEEPIIADYYIGFSVLIAISAISLLTSIFLLKETFCKSKAEFTVLASN